MTLFSCFHFEFLSLKCIQFFFWGGGGPYIIQIIYYIIFRKKCKIFRSIAYFLLYLWCCVYSIYVIDYHRQLKRYMTVIFVRALRTTFAFLNFYEGPLLSSWMLCSIIQLHCTYWCIICKSRMFAWGEYLQVL